MKYNFHLVSIKYHFIYLICYYLYVGSCTATL